MGPVSIWDTGSAPVGSGIGFGACNGSWLGAGVGSVVVAFGEAVGVGVAVEAGVGVVCVPC